jgi:hypothetical protein
MGKRNRQRRTAEQRTRETRTRRPEHTWDPFGGRTSAGQAQDAPPPRVEEVFSAAVHGCRTSDDRTVERSLDRLATMSRLTVATRVQELLAQPLAHLWDGGWQPADLGRLVRRQAGGPEVELLRCVLAADAAGYEDLGRRVAPHWMSQLDALDAGRWWDARTPYVLQLDPGWRATLHAAARLVHLFQTLPRLPVLTPPPGTWRAGMATKVPSNLPPGLLDKVRSLLAKAESTTFDAEAEAFTAKAQELMARHRIDRAVVAADERSTADEPVGRRVTVDDPYADTKALLLAEIADANGGTAVWAKGLGFSTVFAHEDDHDAVETLFTSLLVQATAALRREGSKQDAYGRSRTTRFRRSFLTAFAVRIGQRLREAAEAVVADAEAEAGDVLLPILAARHDSVREATARAFPKTATFGPRATDREGWFAGTLCADRAEVGLGDPLEAAS